jgi:hypothetical protein
MKRPTKAEEALQKQVKSITKQTEELEIRITALRNERDAYYLIRSQLLDEISTIRNLRATTKPKATS